MKPWNIIGWFIVVIIAIAIALALLVAISFGVVKGFSWLIGCLPAGIDWWVEQPAWLKWWIIPSLLLVGVTGYLRVLCSMLDYEG